MKYIILIIMLLISVTFGQYDVTIGKKNMVTVDTFFSNSFDWTKDVNSDEYFVLAFIELYDQYTAECYADSTQNTYGVYEIDGEEYYSGIKSIDPWFNPSYRRLRTIWDHTKPTFQGFIEYLRRIK